MNEVSESEAAALCGSGQRPAHLYAGPANRSNTAAAEYLRNQVGGWGAATSARVRSCAGWRIPFACCCGDGRLQVVPCPAAVASCIWCPSWLPCPEAACRLQGGGAAPASRCLSCRAYLVLLPMRRASRSQPCWPPARPPARRSCCRRRRGCVLMVPVCTLLCLPGSLLVEFTGAVRRCARPGCLRPRMLTNGGRHPPHPTTPPLQYVPPLSLDGRAGSVTLPLPPGMVPSLQPTGPMPAGAAGTAAVSGSANQLVVGSYPSAITAQPPPATGTITTADAMATEGALLLGLQQARAPVQRSAEWLLVMAVTELCIAAGGIIEVSARRGHPRAALAPSLLSHCLRLAQALLQGASLRTRPCRSGDFLIILFPII